MDFPGQEQRIRRALEGALRGATYEGARRPEERLFILAARRQDGRRLELHFRGTREADSTAAPPEGAPLRLEAVRAPRGGCLAIFLPPPLRGPAPGATRVTIRAGDARIDVVCEDVEWFEDTPAGGRGVG